MSQTSRRKLQLVFGAAIFASLGFGATQVVADTRPAEAARYACSPARPIECFCEEGIVYCQTNLPCRACP